MTASLPTRQTPGMPTVFKGEIFQAVGKYARGAVLFAFEEMGGPEELAKWGRRNPDDFYTKLLPKIIARESEVQHTRSVDDIMDLLDGGYTVVEDAQVVPVDAPPEVIHQAQHIMPDDDMSFGMDDIVEMDEWDIDNFVEFPDD